MQKEQKKLQNTTISKKIILHFNSPVPQTDKKLGQKRFGQHFICLTWGWGVIRSRKCQSPNTPDSNSSCYTHQGAGLHPRFYLVYMPTLISMKHTQYKSTLSYQITYTISFHDLWKAEIIFTTKHPILHFNFYQCKKMFYSNRICTHTSTLYYETYYTSMKKKLSVFYQKKWLRSAFAMHCKNWVVLHSLYTQSPL